MLKWLVLLFGWLLVTMPNTSMAEDSTAAPTQLSQHYGRNALRMVGKAPYFVVQDGYYLSALDFALVTRQLEIAQKLRGHQGGATAAGASLGVLGVGGILVGTALTIAGLGGSASMAALGLLTLSGGIAALYGGIRIASRKTAVHTVWSREDAKALVREHNQKLLDASSALPPRRQGLKVRVAICGNGVALAGLF